MYGHARIPRGGHVGPPREGGTPEVLTFCLGNMRLRRLKAAKCRRGTFSQPLRSSAFASEPFRVSSSRSCCLYVSMSVCLYVCLSVSLSLSLSHTLSLSHSLSLSLSRSGWKRRTWSRTAWRACGPASRRRYPKALKCGFNHMPKSYTLHPEP